jgi:hypothetical protein
MLERRWHQEEEKKVRHKEIKKNKNKIEIEYKLNKLK